MRDVCESGVDEDGRSIEARGMERAKGLCKSLTLLISQRYNVFDVVERHVDEWSWYRIHNGNHGFTYTRQPVNGTFKKDQRSAIFDIHLGFRQSDE
jgi:hypothetical protein